MTVKQYEDMMQFNGSQCVHTVTGADVKVMICGQSAHITGNGNNLAVMVKAEYALDTVGDDAEELPRLVYDQLAHEDSSFPPSYSLKSRLKNMIGQIARFGPFQYLGLNFKTTYLVLIKALIKI